jgi:hypothetical protein
MPRFLRWRLAMPLRLSQFRSRPGANVPMLGPSGSSVLQRPGASHVRPAACRAAPELSKRCSPRSQTSCLSNGAPRTECCGRPTWTFGVTSAARETNPAGNSFDEQGGKESSCRQRNKRRCADPARRFPKPKNDLHLGAGDVRVSGVLIGCAPRNLAHLAAALPLRFASVGEMFPHCCKAPSFVSMRLAAPGSGHAGAFSVRSVGMRRSFVRLSTDERGVAPQGQALLVAVFVVAVPLHST